MDQVKRCPYCAEEILAAAVKCKHCGSVLTESGPAILFERQSSADYGWALLTIPVIGIFLLVGWVGDMALIQGPRSMANLIIALVVISTAIVAAIEASKLGMRADRKTGTYSPVQWAFSIMLLWLISYPWYLFKRRSFGRSNLLAPAIIVTVIFAAVSIGMLVMIDQKNQEVQQQIQNIQNSISDAQKSIAQQ